MATDLSETSPRPRRKLWRWVAAVLILAAIAAAAAGPLMSRVEEPDYTIVETSGAIEIRDYAPMIAAETSVEGERTAAIGEGFRRIAGYIFGDNAPREKIAMTVPVQQQKGSTIAMTAPVQQQGANGTWSVRFIMPKQWTMETLPAPVDERVKLVPIPARRFAVIRFSGSAGQAALDAKTSELQEFVRARGMTPQGEPLYAFYNPPWTLPFFKRNEVMLEVAGAGQ
jgi:hypothetical protein